MNSDLLTLILVKVWENSPEKYEILIKFLPLYPKRLCSPMVLALDCKWDLFCNFWQDLNSPCFVDEVLDRWISWTLPQGGKFLRNLYIIFTHRLTGLNLFLVLPLWGLKTIINNSPHFLQSVFRRLNSKRMNQFQFDIPAF